jgi:hypothetical protein
MFLQIQYIFSLMVLVMLTPLPSPSLILPINECPAITAECISTPDCCGPDFEFVVHISNIRSTDKPIYKWIVSAGTIICGQGTPSIKVSGREIAGQSVTATVEIDGLEPNCSKTTSVSQNICEYTRPRSLFDKYGKLSFACSVEKL